MSENIDFAKVLEALSEPFSTVDVEWKPGATNREKTSALALAYVESRAYIQRLNTLCEGEWSDDYQIYTLPDRVVVICRLTLYGVTRTGDGECLLSAGDSDYVEANAVTTASAQAFKRACVKFGLGSYLYSLPQKWCEYDAKTRRIVSPPSLPDWAVPFGEREAYKAAVAGNGNGSSVAKPAPAATPAPAAKPATVSTTVAAPAPAPAAKPSTSAPDAIDPGQTIIHFGRYANKTLADVNALGKDGAGWLKWCASTFEPKNERDSALKKAVKAFLLLQGQEETTF